MRWPWRSRSDGQTAPVADTPVPQPEPAPAVARPHAEWRRVASLRPTADPHPPALIAPGLPALASTRSLLHRERTDPDVDAPEPGRVGGLASVYSTPTVEARPVARQQPAERDVVAARPQRRAPLTVAVAEYVGEARVPATPYRAPAWLRSASAAPQVMTPLDAFVTQPPKMDAPAGRSVPPEVAMLDAWTGTPPVVVPSEPEPQAADETPALTPPTPPIRRRRRPGLGLPLPLGERPPTPQPAQPPQPQPEPRARVETPKVVAAIEPPRQQPSVPVTEGATGPQLVHPIVPGRFSARIPNDLVETFERAYGVEVADVAVDRSPAASAQARVIGARAFAHQDLIALPEEIGPVESTEARALLGHELAHVVQQRTIGSIPTESDTDGQRLEAAARSVEEWVRAGASGPPPPAVPPDPGAPPEPGGAPPEAPQRSGPAPVRRRASAGPPSRAGAPQRAVAGATVSPPATTATTPTTTDAPHTAGRVTTSTSPATTTSTSPTTPTTPALVHPPGQQGTQNHDPLNPRNAHEYGALVRDSFAHLGADMLGIGSLLGSHQSTPPPSTSQQGGARSTTSTSGTTTGTGTGTGTTSTTGGGPGSGSIFAGGRVDRDTRRQQLTNDALERMNTARQMQGQAALAELPPTEQAAIEAQLDAEGLTGGQSAPVVHNWHEFRDQFRLGGGELLGGLIGYNPVDAAERERHQAEADARARQQQQQQQQQATTSTTGATGTGTGSGTPADHAIGHADRPATPEPTGAEMARLYDRIHTRLVRELLVGRERSGTLMDFR